MRHAVAKSDKMESGSRKAKLAREKELSRKEKKNVVKRSALPEVRSAKTRGFHAERELRKPKKRKTDPKARIAEN